MLITLYLSMKLQSKQIAIDDFRIGNVSRLQYLKIMLVFYRPISEVNIGRSTTMEQCILSGGARVVIYLYWKTNTVKKKANLFITLLIKATQFFSTRKSLMKSLRYRSVKSRKTVI